MSDKKQMSRHPLRCPCCGTHLTDTTPEAEIRSRNVRKWFFKIMGIIVVANVLLLAGWILQVTMPQSGYQFVIGAAMGLAVGGVVLLRDHWISRRVE